MENNQRERAWVEYSILALITLLAAALRFYKLGEWSYYVDELHTLEDTLRSQSYTQPFWTITKLSLSTFGIDAFALRFFPCIFGILSIPLLYVLFKSICNYRAALLATLLMAISPWHIYLSQLARWYSLLLLVSTASLIMFYLYIERQSLGYLGGSIILFFVALSLHLTGGFVLMISITYVILLLLLPDFQPSHFNSKKALILLCLLGGIGVLFIPEFLHFIDRWESVKEQFGYWGNTPGRLLSYILYHLTPSIAVMSLGGVVLLLRQRERAGLFLSVYCMAPVFLLVVAAALQTNASSKYVFFTLPGILLVASYFCCHIVDRVGINAKVLAAMIIVAIILPSLQSDYLYFTSGYGHRNRMNEAISFIQGQVRGDDQIFIRSSRPKEQIFKFRMSSRLAGLDLREDQVVGALRAEDVDVDKRIWVIGIKHRVSPDGKGFDKWIADHTKLVAEFRANRGPEDNSVRVYLHSPESRRDIVLSSKKVE